MPLFIGEPVAFVGRLAGASATIVCDINAHLRREEGEQQKEAGRKTGSGGQRERRCCRMGRKV